MLPVHVAVFTVCACPARVKLPHSGQPELLLDNLVGDGEVGGAANAGRDEGHFVLEWGNGEGDQGKERS